MVRIHTPRGLLLAALLAATALPVRALAEDPPGTTPEPQRPPEIRPADSIELNGTYKIRDLITYFARVLGQNYILEGGASTLSEEVSIISHKAVSPRVAEQAFVAALEMAGYTIVDVGGMKQIIKTGDASQNPVLVGEGDTLPASDARYVTQIIQLENVQVSDVNSVVTALASSDAKVIAYAPTNTLILTDTVPNLRKVQDVLQKLDVAAPKSRLEIIALKYAKADEVAKIITDVYGVGQAAGAPAAAAEAPAARRPRRAAAAETPAPATPVTAGAEQTYISKVLPDERTNSLIVLANDEGFEQIRDLLEDIDVDVDMSSRSQIHVVYLQNAKAEDVAGVLANLSESGSRTAAATPAARRATTTTSRTGAGTATTGGEAAAGEATGVIAAFDSGMRITHDESTNSLVIIASPEDFEVVQSVIKKLDVRRKQVFVDAVILEIGSTDSTELGLAYHGPMETGSDAAGFLGGQFGATSLGLTQDLLSGLAVGVFGQSIEVPFSSGAGVTTLEVPAFGIVVSALRSNSLVSIVSNPNLLTLDNQEAKIVVGRQIPFPTSSGLNSLGQPVISYQREDVATELTITPRINSSNEVTLEITAEVSEIEEDNQGLDVNQAGFITSKREIETSALVQNNQTVALGGLVGMTDTEVETKVPILGDLPLVGVLFRGSRVESRRTNLMVFLTPHIIEDEDDMVEVLRVKEAQRQEFYRRFYGKSRDEQLEEIRELMSYSMNFVGEPSVYRGSVETGEVTIEGSRLDDETRAALEDVLREYEAEPGAGAGEIGDEAPVIELPEGPLPDEAP